MQILNLGRLCFFQSQQSFLCLRNHPTSPTENPLTWDKKCFKALSGYSVENALLIWDPSIHDEDTSSVPQVPTFTHVLPVIPLKTSKLFFWKRGGKNQPKILEVELCKSPGPFFVMATQSYGHKVWLEMFRLELEEMSPRKAVQPWSSAQKGGEISVVLHFLPQTFPQISMIPKAQHWSHKLCSHPHLTHWSHGCFPLSWGATVFSCSTGRRGIISCFLHIFPDDSRMMPVMS